MTDNEHPRRTDHIQVADEANDYDDYEPDERGIKGVNYDLEMPEMKGAPKKKFWNTDVGRTLKAENKVGKVIYGVGTGVLGAATGINIDPLTDLITQNEGGIMLEFLGDFNLLSFVFMLVAVGLGYLKSRAGNALDSVYEQAKIGFNMMSDFKKKASDGGKSITEEEKDQIIEQAGRVFEAIIGVIKPHIFSRDNK